MPAVPDLRVGQVGNPGMIEVDPGTTLLQAIAVAGGLDRFAAAKRIQLRRTDPATHRERLFLFNYRAVEGGGPIESMITLREGDVIARSPNATSSVRARMRRASLAVLILAGVTGESALAQNIGGPTVMNPAYDPAINPAINPEINPAINPRSIRPRSGCSRPWPRAPPSRPERDLRPDAPSPTC